MPALSRPAYRFSDNANSSQSQEFGNYILKRGMGEIRKPTWQRTETVVRFLPQWDFAENRWSPFRLSSSPMDFGDWLRRYEAVRGFGENGVTFLLYDPVTNPSYDTNSNPCVILHKAINSAIDNKTCDPDWPALFKGGANRAAALKKHQALYIARCGIFRIKSRDMATADRAPLGLGQNDQPFFMEIPKTAGERLVSMLEEPAENFEGSADDYASAYKYGDIVSLDKGAYVHFFEEGADPRKTGGGYQQAAPRQLQVNTGGRGNYGGGGGGSNFKGYDAYIDNTFNDYVAQLNTPELERLIKSKQRPWEDCLQFFNHQEQAFLVQDGFPARAIMYAWRDHPEWIKDETRSKAVGRVTAGVDQRIQYPADITFQSGGVASPAVVTPPRTSAQAGQVASAPAGRTPGQVSSGTGTSPETTTFSAPNPNIKIGGWGNQSSEAADPEAPARDTVVPAGISSAEQGTPMAVDGALGNVMSAKELAAFNALKAAQDRVAERTQP